VKRLLLLFLLINYTLISSGQENCNLYFWNTTSISSGLSQSLTLTLKVKTQILVSESSRELSYIDFGLARNLNDWFKLGVAFRMVEIPNDEDNIYEYRPQVIATIQNSGNNINFRFSNRIGHRTLSNGNNHFRHYQNLFIDLPEIISNLPKPYIGEELFTKLNGEGTHQFRFFGGLHVWQKSYVNVDMFYAWQKNKEEQTWLNSEIVGLNLKFKI